MTYLQTLRRLTTPRGKGGGEGESGPEVIRDVHADGPYFNIEDVSLTSTWSKSSPPQPTCEMKHIIHFLLASAANCLCNNSAKEGSTDRLQPGHIFQSIFQMSCHGTIIGTRFRPTLGWVRCFFFYLQLLGKPQNPDSTIGPRKLLNGHKIISFLLCNYGARGAMRFCGRDSMATAMN